MANSEYDEERSVGDKGEKDVYVVETGAVHTEALTDGHGLRAKLMRLAGKFGVEQRGIERVPEDERTDVNGVANVGTMVCAIYRRRYTLMNFMFLVHSGSQPTWSSAHSL